MILLRMEKKSSAKNPRCIDDDALENIMDDEEVFIIQNYNNLDKFNLLWF